MCLHTTQDFLESDPNYVLLLGKDGTLADLEAEFIEKHGSRKSGFLLLDNNAESLQQRLMLIDWARYSLDIKYYLWNGDDSGELIFKRALDAATRGVRVWVITDDIRTRQPAQSFWQRVMDAFFKLFPGKYF
jgi:phosphatidylserine/phosphatidylglycerophosphate/cardiolipin synthase-like enzyme